MEQTTLIERPLALHDKRILLLEDDALISIDMEDMLLSLGVRQVLVAHTIEEARALAERETVDAAVLDLVIGQDRCEDFAIQMAARRVPIVFASGMHDTASLPEALREVQTVDKPCTTQALHAALSRAIRFAG